MFKQTKALLVQLVEIFILQKIVRILDISQEQNLSFIVFIQKHMASNLYDISDLKSKVPYHRK